MLMEAYLHTVLLMSFLQFVAVNPTVRIKNHALDTKGLVLGVLVAFYYRPTALVQGASRFM